MATSMISKPGTKYGPCEDDGCGHSDCAELRRLAAAVCIKCDDLIGYDSRFARVIGSGSVHLRCFDYLNGKE